MRPRRASHRPSFPAQDDPQFVTRQRVHELVIKEIQKSLASGELRPGDRLPTERKMATTFGVSRPSLREALSVLEAMGIVERTRNGSAFAKEPGMATLVTPFTMILEDQRLFLTQTLEFRRMVEPLIARLAAERASPAEVQELQAILERQRTKVRLSQSAIDEDSAFHAALARFTRNDIIARVMRALNSTMREWRTVWLQGRPAFSAAGHQDIVGAIERGDGAAAEDAMRRHLEFVESQVAAYMRRDDQAGVLASSITRRAANRAARRRSP